MSVGRKTFLFLGTIFLFTAVSSYLVFGMIEFSQSNPYLMVFWAIGFIILTLNIGYMLMSSIVAFFFTYIPLKEAVLSDLPPTAITYVVRNEKASVLYKNLYTSFSNNHEKNIDLWLLSNTDDPEFQQTEQKVIAQLQEEFGSDRINYFQTHDNTLRRKHVCIQQWIREVPLYTYFVVCDADSLLPQNVVKKLIAKAEHPENKDICLFQTQINIAQQRTRFGRFLGIGQDICQRIYSRANQMVFGGGVSYGSGSLIRTEQFKLLEIPDWVLSHDIWDTVAMVEQKYRVVFCSDVITYGSFPDNYIEYLKRSSRWIKGTLESLPFCLKRRIPAGTRFMVVYPSYMYAIQPLFLLWILSGFFYNNNMWDTLLVTQKYAFLGGSFVDLEMGSHMVMTMTIVAGHRFIMCRSVKEVLSVFTELLTTMMLCLNSIIFDSFSVVKWIFSHKKGTEWVAMKKGEDTIRLADVARFLWPVTAFGIVCVMAGIFFSPLWLLFASPFICSFVLGIPLAYWTSKYKISDEEKQID